MKKHNQIKMKHCIHKIYFVNQYRFSIGVFMIEKARKLVYLSISMVKKYLVYISIYTENRRRVIKNWIIFVETCFFMIN